MAATAQINFKIGGVDAVSRAILTIGQATERAIRQGVRTEQQANKERKQSAKATERAIAAEKSAADKEVARQTREALAVVKAANREKLAEERRTQSEVVAVVRAANREKLADERRVEREKRRAENRERNRAEQTVRERQRLLGGMIGGGVSGAVSGAGRALGMARSAAGTGMGLASSLMGGAGVEVGLGRAVRVRAELEKRAIDLSNSAYQENGVGIQRERVDPKALMAEANRVAQATATDPTKALEGLQGFVGVTGDLATGRELMGDLAKLARATGTDLDHMVKAAGEMGKGMGDAATNTEDARAKAAAIYSVMKGLAGQGKLGSVEVKDMAVHGARLAAAATQFEGDAGANMMKMGMLAQTARGGGGAWNAATAAGAVSGLVTTFKTDTRRAAFKKEGISLEGEGGKIRDPSKILVEAIDKTGADIDKLTPMFRNVVGARAMQGLANKYLEGSGGGTDVQSRAKGRAAVEAEIDRMTKGAAMKDEEVDTSFKTSMGGMEAKAQVFQQNIDKIAGDMADKLIPAMLKFVPVAEKGADALIKFVEAIVPHAPALAASLAQLVPVMVSATPAMAKLFGFVANHPLLAAGAVVGAGAAQGVVGAALSSAVTQGIMGAGAAGAAGTAGAAVAGGGLKAALMGGAALSGTTVAAVGASGLLGFGAGSLMADAANGNLNNRQKILNEANSLEFRMRDTGGTDAERAQATALLEKLRGGFGGVTGFVDKVTGGDQAERASQMADQLAAALAKTPTKLDPNTQVQIAPGTELTVRVSNASEIGGNLQGSKAQLE